MSGPALGIDPAVAAALDLYSVPPPSAGFADRIAATAAGRRQERVGGRERPLRDRRGPWRQRVIVGGLAMLLGTAAAATTLLERAGIHLPAIVAMLSPPAPPEPEAAEAVRHRPRAVPLPVRRSAEAVAHAPAPVGTALAIPTPPPTLVPVPTPRPLPPRLAMIRARLAAMPPAERRVVVGRVVQRVAERAAVRRAEMADASQPRLAPPAEGQWLRSHPLVRAAVGERIAAMRDDAPTQSRQERGAAVALPSAEGRSLPPVERVDAGPSAMQRPAVQATTSQERSERLRGLRSMRTLRQGWRRLRRP